VFPPFIADGTFRQPMKLLSTSLYLADFHSSNISSIRSPLRCLEHRSWTCPERDSPSCIWTCTRNPFSNWPSVDWLQIWSGHHHVNHSSQCRRGKRDPEPGSAAKGM